MLVREAFVGSAAADPAIFHPNAWTCVPFLLTVMYFYEPVARALGVLVPHITQLDTLFTGL